MNFRENVNLLGCANQGGRTRFDIMLASLTPTLYNTPQMHVFLTIAAQKKMTTNLAKATSTVGSMTLMSRILGFVRDMVTAQIFGAGAGYDAFLVAFKIPNFMRSLFAEGGFSQAFVPLLSEQQTKTSHAEVKDFVSKVAGCLGLVTLLVTLLGMLGAPYVIRVFAPGFSDDLNRFQLAIDLLYITLPYLLLISLTAFSGGILNTYNRFAVPAFTPTLLNVAMILSCLLLTPWFDEPIKALAWGVFLGGVLQLLFQIPFLWQLNLLPRFKIAFGDARVKRLLKMMLPALIGLSVVQINLLLSTVFASFLPTGSLSWIYYADHLMQFPLGVFGIALATAVLPHLSKHHVQGHHQHYLSSLNWALRTVLLIGVPAAIGLFCLSLPLMTTLFHYGRFSAFDIMQSLGAAFYARQDIKTPMYVAIVALITNIVLSYIFMQYWQHVGLAIAMVCSSTVNALGMWIILQRRRIFSFAGGWLPFLARLIVAAGLMIAWLMYGSGESGHWFDLHWSTRVMKLAYLIVVGAAIYFVALWLTGLRMHHIRPPAVSLPASS